MNNPVPDWVRVAAQDNAMRRYHTRGGQVTSVVYMGTFPHLDDDEWVDRGVDQVWDIRDSKDPEPTWGLKVYEVSAP